MSVPGPLTMLFGYVLLGLQPLPVKALSHHGWHAPLVVVARFAFTMVCVLVICVARRRGLRTGQPGLLLLRGVLGAIAVLLYFTSIQLAGAGPGTILNYMYPLWTNLLAVVFLRRRPPRLFWPLLLLAMVGAWLIVGPSFRAGALSSPARLGELCGVVSAIASGGAVLCIKLLRETDESLTIITSFSAIGLLLALPFAFVPSWLGVAATSPSLESGELSLAFAVGALAFAGHLYFTRGYRGTSVPLGTALSLSVPLVAALAGAALFGEKLGLRFVLGGMLVLGSCLGIAWLEMPPKKRPA